jgi:hypothetical protein
MTLKRNSSNFFTAPLEKIFKHGILQNFLPRRGKPILIPHQFDDLTLVITPTSGDFCHLDHSKIDRLLVLGPSSENRQLRSIPERGKMP